MNGTQKPPKQSNGLLKNGCREILSPAAQYDIFFFSFFFFNDTATTEIYTLSLHDALPISPARNPWNPRHHPGGSSSGSGAGLASGMFPLALGSDTGGSIRNPASVCGIVGLKPTYGLVSRRGVFPLSFTLDHIGPMTRTVTDNAVMLQAIAGHDPLDPGSAATRNGHYVAGIERPVRDLRIGFIRHFHEVDVPAEPEVTA